MNWFLFDRDLRHERVKPTYFFINSKNKKAMINFWSRLWPYEINIDILKTYSTVKLMPEACLEPTIYNPQYITHEHLLQSFFVIFTEKLHHTCSTGFQIRLCIHLHTGQSHRNYMHIEYFCCKLHFFWQEKNEIN